MAAVDTISRPPGYTSESFPEFFNLHAMPKQQEKEKPGQLSERLVRQYFEDGYIILKDFFTPEELNPCRDAVNELVEELAQKLYKAGKIKELYSNYGFFERLTQIEKEFPGANIILHKYPELRKAFKNVWANDRLLNVIEQILGPDIAGHPLWNLRTKTPQNEATTVPWHQDVGYLDNSSYKVLQPTAWIPLLDANETNGCMQVTHRGHKTGRVGTHKCCHGGTWYVMLEDEELESTLEIDLKKDIKTCEVPYGGVLLLNNMIPHRSLSNLSGEVRWSLDLRWQRPNEPYGFYGVKQGVVMRKATDPSFKVDWETFDNLGRYELLREAVTDTEEDEFDITIQGPWMKKWDIVHMNHHVERFNKANAARMQ